MSQISDLVQIAHGVLELKRENEYLKQRVLELQEYEEKYHQLLNESVAHGQQMMGNWLTLLSNPKFGQAMHELGKTKNAVE